MHIFIKESFATRAFKLSGNVIFFQTFDENGDGYLNAGELKKGMSSVMSKEEIEEMFLLADVDGDGRLCYQGSYDSII